MYKIFRYSLIIFLALVTSNSVFAQDEEPTEMTMEDWQRMQDEYTAKKDHLTIQLNNLNIEIDGLKRSNSDKDAALTKAESDLYASVGSTKSGVADNRKDFEETEKMINSKSGNLADARKKFEILKASKVRCLPEFWDRFNAMEKKLLDWEKPNYRNEIENLEKIINNREGNINNAIKKFNDLKASKINELPEYSTAFENIKTNLKKWVDEEKSKIVVQVKTETYSDGRVVTTTTVTSPNIENPLSEDNKPVEIAGYIAYFIPKNMEVNKEYIVKVITTNVSIKDSIPFGDWENEKNNFKCFPIQLKDTILIMLESGKDIFLVSLLSHFQVQKVNRRNIWTWSIIPQKEGEYNLQVNAIGGEGYIGKPETIEASFPFFIKLINLIDAHWDKLIYILGLFSIAAIIKYFKKIKSKITEWYHNLKLYLNKKKHK